MIGIIVRFFDIKHFGFLNFVTQASATGEEIAGGELFFHEIDAPEMAGAFKRGDKVTFEIGEYNGRKKAFNVRPFVSTNGVQS
jgi:cold shock CspA family protein